MASIPVNIKPEMLRWACERAGDTVESFLVKHKKSHLRRWLHGEKQPTLRQLEEFAKQSRAPIGYLFLETPPAEPLPIPDFRTMGSEPLGRPTPDLLDTIYLCQQRQDWYRQNALMLGEPPLDFIGADTVQSDVVATAASIRRSVGFDLDARTEASTFLDALSMMIDAADEAGILVMVSGVVGNNSNRPLDVAEFRGFALSDNYAPLIFINGTDTKSGQMFTLAHELAHLWLGESGVSDVTPASSLTASAGGATVERWCNAVAAEMLVPLDGFRQAYRRQAELLPEMQRLSRQYKVSTLVILRRMLDADGLTRDVFQKAFAAEVQRLRAEIAKKKEKSKGGDTYANVRVRVSPRFGRALIAATWEGRATFTEASRLLGFKRVETIERFGKELGLAEYLHGGAV